MREKILRNNFEKVNKVIRERERERAGGFVYIHEFI